VQGTGIAILCDLVMLRGDGYPSRVEIRVFRPLRVVMCALLAGACAASAAHAQRAATQALVVTFNANGAVTVTLNGSPVGTTSGQPTVISGGYYSLVMNGPGDCINLPLFELSGPGVDIQDDMLGGEVDTHTVPMYFAPNSTFTWHIDRAQSTVYTFRTSPDVTGSATAVGSSSTASGKGGATSEDVVGSAIVPTRGTLAGVVTPAGRLAIAYKGKPVKTLQAGRYTISVVDESSSNGFVVKGSRKAVSVTGMPFVGKHSVTLDLTAGRWSFGPSAAKSSYTVSVLG